MENTAEIVQTLTRIEEQLKSYNKNIQDLCTIVSADRTNLWRLATICLIGVFALVGIKLAYN